MTAVTERAEDLLDQGADVLQSPDIFSIQIDTLRERLEKYGETDHSLGGIQIFAAEADQEERFKYADGQDASNFFRTGQANGKEQAGIRIVFRDEDGYSVTPNLCVRVETPGNETPFNYIVSGGHLFQLTTLQQQELSPRTTAERTPQTIYNHGSIAHTSEGDWVSQTEMPRPPIEVQKIPSTKAINFMTALEKFSFTRSAITKKERAQTSQQQVSIIQPPAQVFDGVRPYIERSS